MSATETVGGASCPDGDWQSLASYSLVGGASCPDGDAVNYSGGHFRHRPKKKVKPQLEKGAVLH